MLAYDLQADPNDRWRREPRELWKMLTARQAQFMERNLLYSVLLSYYRGKPGRGSRALHEVLGSTSTGRPLLRDLGVSLEIQRKYVSNRMAPIVEDYQALVGRMPAVRVEPPAPDETGEAKAEKQTKYLYSTFAEVDMAYHAAFAGFTLSCLGDAVYVLEVDSRSSRVLPSSVLPMWCYPSWQRGPRKFQLWDLIVANVWDPDDIRREFGFNPRSEEASDCNVLVYTSPYQRTVLVGSEAEFRVPHDAKWDLGFCPAIWVRNKVSADLASSDIAPVLALQDMYDFTLNVMADGLVEMTYPMRMVKGQINRGDGPAAIGPGANVEVGPEGDLKVVSLAPPPQAGMMMAHTVLDDMNIGSGTSSVRQQGMPDRSNISGRAIHAAQGPQATRIDLKQILNGAALIRLFAQLMAMQEKAPLLGHAKLDIHGRYKGFAFKEEFIPKKDIDGWYLNTVTWDELVGVNRQQRIQMAVELKQSRLADTKYAMELAGIENPVEMEKRVESDLRREQRMQLELQQGQPAGGVPGGGQGPGGPPQQGPPTASPSPPPPQMVFRPPEQAGTGGAAGAGPGAMALPTGVPSGISRKAVEQRLQGAKLSGQVFAVGDLARAGQAPRVTLRISDQRDYRAVREAVLPLDPKPDIRFQREDRMPEEKVLVA